MRIGFERTPQVFSLTPAIYWDWGSWAVGIVFLCFHLHLEYNRDTRTEPACFAKEFGPLKEVCKACTLKKECKEEFLKIDEQNRGGDATPEKKG